MKKHTGAITDFFFFFYWSMAFDLRQCTTLYMTSSTGFFIGQESNNNFDNGLTGSTRTT